jgi:hypothetical protein
VPDSEIDLLSISRGSVTAPAGCGKTALIAEALSRHRQSAPILVLTHTNAGVAALRQRLKDGGVPSTRYRLATIDGWAIHLIATFPVRAGHNPAILTSSKPNYDAVHVAAWNLLKAGHVNDVITSSYSRMLVDEYQDCSPGHHAILKRLSELIPTAVLGDPLQAVFEFRPGSVVTWAEVQTWFTPAGELSTPWRWINAGAPDLGEWLLSARETLLRGEPLQIGGVPRVTWVELDGVRDAELRQGAAEHVPPDGPGSVLVIEESRDPAGQRRVARQVHGATAVEAADLRDLLDFAGTWVVGSPDALEKLATFGGLVMRNVDVDRLMRRLESLRTGTTQRAASEVEMLALRFLDEPTHAVAGDVLEAMSRTGNRVPHRPVVHRACIRALRNCDGNDGNTFMVAALRERETNRTLVRPISGRSVGSTLLLKGLEADAVVVLYADQLDAKNLYVAMTRGSRSVVICSRTSLLRPALAHRESTRMPSFPSNT